MADPHDTHQQGRGFWGCANIALAAAFATFAGIAGIALIAGGLSRPVGPEPGGEVKAAAAAPATPPLSLSPTPGSGDTVEVLIKPDITNPMAYDVKTINARAGQKVKITFKNEHPAAPLQHSLLICKIGSRERMYAVSDAMMSDMVKWLAKGFIPESTDVLHHTKLLNAGETETLEFIAGPEKGEYPYLCTFPGHPRIMQGTLKVE